MTTSNRSLRDRVAHLTHSQAPRLLRPKGGSGKSYQFSARKEGR